MNFLGWSEISAAEKAVQVYAPIAQGILPDPLWVRNLFEPVGEYIPTEETKQSNAQPVLSQIRHQWH